MTSKEWADRVILDLHRIRDSIKPIGTGVNRSPVAYSIGGTPQTPSSINGAAIAQALSDYLKSNNSTTQSLSIRITDLAARYKQRAA